MAWAVPEHKQVPGTKARGLRSPLSPSHTNPFSSW